MDYLTLKWLHVLFSTLLFGTGIGSAFYLLVTTLTRDVRAIAIVSSIVVVADWMFTATTAVLQPLTGFWMMHLVGWTISTPWLAWSIALYVVALACWIPVVFLQMRLRDLAHHAMHAGRPLPRAYWRCFAMWVALGIPAFIAFVIIFYLMVAKGA